MQNRERIHRFYGWLAWEFPAKAAEKNNSSCNEGLKPILYYEFYTFGPQNHET